MTDFLVDGATDFLGGQDSSKIPDRIPENAYAAGINVSVANGVLHPRWGLVRFSNEFEDGYILDPYRHTRTYRSIFESGKFQAAAPYYVGLELYIILVISGHIFAFNPDSKTIVHVPIEDGSDLNYRAQRINWAAAGKHLVLYDFPAYPVILDGLNARRSNPLDLEIPAASQGAFNQNRLFIANNGSEFTGGDPVGSLAAPDAPLTFLEVLTPGSPYYGQIFQLPTSDHNDPITFMGFLQVTDVSTGIGPLIIATDRAIYSYATHVPRSNWEQGQFGSLLCYNAGVAGPRAFANANSDAFFLANDGYVRSLSMSRSEQQAWARIPISIEVKKWFKAWDSSLIKLGFVSYFNNKLFFSVNPYRVSVTDFETQFPVADYAHGGLVVMELDTLTSFGQAAKPTWAGLWTGVRPMEMVNLGTRAFIISKDLTNINRIYEINPDITYDIADDYIRPVKSRVRTREYSFQDGFLNKEIHSIDVVLEKIQGDFSMDVNYKPGHGFCFLPWVEFKHHAPWRMCDMPLTCVNGFEGHAFRDLTFGAPDPGEECSPLTADYYRVFKKLQLEVTLQGAYWELHELRVKATPKPQTVNAVFCEQAPTVPICSCCEDEDWSIEDFKTCETMVT